MHVIKEYLLDNPSENGLDHLGTDIYFSGWEAVTHECLGLCYHIS